MKNHKFLIRSLSTSRAPIKSAVSLKEFLKNRDNELSISPSENSELVQNIPNTSLSFFIETYGKYYYFYNKKYMDILSDFI
jgi:hypothetical protein